jgi:hypothetical protein
MFPGLVAISSPIRQTHRGAGRMVEGKSVRLALNGIILSIFIDNMSAPEDDLLRLTIPGIADTEAPLRSATHTEPYNSLEVVCR